MYTTQNSSVVRLYITHISRSLPRRLPRIHSTETRYPFRTPVNHFIDMSTQFSVPTFVMRKTGADYVTELN